MKDDTRAGLLRDYVQELKGMLPNSYDEAWNHPDEKFRERWRAAIRKEIKSLVKMRKVWKRASIQNGRGRLIKSKWNFNVKRNGIFKVIFVKTKDNDADIIMRNPGGELHEHHSKKMIIDKGKV